MTTAPQRFGTTEIPQTISTPLATREEMSAPSNHALSNILNSNDLVHCLTQLIPSRAHLGSLCLVSKEFNAAFSPALYSRIVFHDGNAHLLRDPEQLKRLVANYRLQFARALSFNLIEGSWTVGNTHEVGRLVDPPGYGRYGDIRRWAWTYNESIISILERMPRIVSFQWEAWPISQRLQDYLSEKCSSLRDVSIAYPNLSRFARTERFYRERASFDLELPHMIPSPFPNFKLLRALRLFEICGDLTLWIKVISTTLQNSPFIQELGLSLSTECERSYTENKKGVSERSYYTLLNFLTLIIEEFKASNSGPLRLKALKLGYGVLFNDPEEPDGRISPTPLSDLTDLSLLEELYIDNDLDIGCALGSRDTLGRLSWRSITPIVMPNLNRFTFTSLSERSRDWLCNRVDAHFLASLKLGIGTERLTYSFIDPGDGTLMRVDSQSIHHHMGIFNERTFFLKEYKKGQYANFPIKCKTLLLLKIHCIPGDYIALKSCTWLQTLVVCFKKHADALLLRNFLKALPPLDNLWIRVGMDYPLPQGGEETRHKGNAIRDADDNLVDEQLYLHDFWRSKWRTMAELVASNRSCPLRYLKIGHLTWRVLPRAKGAPKSVLELLDRWETEAECPDVFQYNDPVRRDRMY